MYICVCVCIHTCIYDVCVSYVYCLEMCTWGALPCKCMHRGQSSASDIFLYDYPPDLLRQSVFLRPQHTVSVSLASQWTPGSDSPAPSSGATEVHHHSQLLNTCWGFKLRLPSLCHMGNKLINHWTSLQPLLRVFLHNFLCFLPHFKYVFVFYPQL